MSTIMRDNTMTIKKKTSQAIYSNQDVSFSLISFENYQSHGRFSLIYSIKGAAGIYEWNHSLCLQTNVNFKKSASSKL